MADVAVLFIVPHVGYHLQRLGNALHYAEHGDGDKRRRAKECNLARHDDTQQCLNGVCDEVGKPRAGG